MTAIESTPRGPGWNSALAIWSALGVITPCLAPNLGPFVLLLAMIAPLALCDRSDFDARVRNPDRIVQVLYLIVGYLCLNATFAPSPNNAAGAIATIAAAGAAVLVCSAACPTLPEREARAMARGIALGCCLTAGYFAVEYVSGLPVQRAAAAIADIVRFRPLQIESGTSQSTILTHMSRNLAVLIALSWPAMALAMGLTSMHRRRLLSFSILTLVAVATFHSPSATAKVGFVAGCAMWLMVAYAQKIAAALLYATWVIVSLGCIPIAHLIHKLRLYEVDWIGNSGRHRLLIWSASADWFWRNPVMGLGVGGARVTNLNAELQLSARGLKDEPLNWHAHNAFIQMWFEAGAIGGVLLCLLGILILRSAFRLPANLRPFAVATFTSIFFISMTGFSLWASWYLAAFGLAAILFIVTASIDRGAVPLPQPLRE